MRVETHRTTGFGVNRYRPTSESKPIRNPQVRADLERQYAEYSAWRKTWNAKMEESTP